MSEPTLFDHLDDLRTELLTWFDAHKREMPWRAEDPNPYHVWLSEVMLQQTQVDTVRPYFRRWIERFPTVHALAEAPLDDVMSLWSGLGYYQRARRLHSAAQRIVEQHQGAFPQAFSDILDLPGVGRYTAGAIASIAFGQRKPVLDGNVARVLARLHAIEGDPTQTAVSKRLWAEAEKLLPSSRVGDFNQALMELGALICRPKGPSCVRCPIAPWCQARIQGRTAELPTPKARPEKKHVVSGALLITHPEDEARVLLAQRPREGLLSGLWELPQLIMTPRRIPRRPKPPLSASAANRKKLARFARRELGLVLDVLEPQPVVRHTFTHLKWMMVPWQTRLKGAHAVDLSESSYLAWRFVSRDELGELGVPKMVHKALAR